MSKIDLHIHSNISLDGSDSIEEIVLKAYKSGMTHISITDHNSIKGVSKAQSIGSKYGIKVIPGIEIDCVYQNIEFHMTAYNINIHDNKFNEIENFYINNAKKNTWDATYRFLSVMNIDISNEVLKSIATQGVIVPEDLCDYLLNTEKFNDLELLKPYRKGGIRSNNPNLNFYWDYFSQNKIGYFKEEKLNALDVIEIIHNSGGLAFVAHPKANFENNDNILRELLKKVDGLEVFSTYHNDEDCMYYMNLAKEFNLKISCGSDYHGHHKPNIKIGEIPGNNIETYIKWD